MKEFLRFTVFVMSQFTRFFLLSLHVLVKVLKGDSFSCCFFFFYLYLVGTEAEAQILYASVYMKL